MPATSQPSAESAILAALQASNPFERAPVVKEQNVWGESFPDISSLNAKASDSVFDAIRKLRAADSSLDKVTSIVFTSDRGVGKSHVIRRVRKRLQATGEGAFVYASADKYGDLNLINSLFQQSVAESLDQLSGEGVTQWQEIATLMVAEALRAHNPKATIPSPSNMVRKFDKVVQKHRKAGRDLVSELVKAVRKLKPKADPYLLRAIVWTLSEERGVLAVKWLAGEEIETQDAIDLRLPQNNKTEDEKNAAALSTTAEMISLAGEHKTVVVCFDELDTIAANEDGFSAAFVILDLVKRLFGAIKQSDRAKGVVTLTVLLPNIWRQVEQTKDASAEKISAYSKPIDLEYLNAETARDLVALTLKKFYARKGLVPSTDIYPFEADAIAAYGKNKPSPREALKWFADELNKKIADATPTVSPTERFERAYDNALAQVDIEELEDNDQVAAAIRFGFEKIIDIDKIREQSIEGVSLKRIAEITPKSRNNGWLSFKVVGEENNAPVVIGVSALQNTGGRAVGAAFKRLLDTETFGLSRGCLVRSRSRKIKRYWDSYGYYQQLIAAGGEWVDLVEAEIKPLLALQYVYEHHEKFDLTIKRLDSFAFVRKLLQENPLLREILSKPEGAIAEDALEGNEVEHLTDETTSESLEANLEKALALEEDDSAEEKTNLKELADVMSA